jgi:hypothetical protein
MFNIVTSTYHKIPIWYIFVNSAIKLSVSVCVKKSIEAHILQHTDMYLIWITQDTYRICMRKSLFSLENAVGNDTDMQGYGMGTFGEFF